MSHVGPYLHGYSGEAMPLPEVSQNMAPIFAHYFGVKVGRGHSLEYSSSPMRTPPQFLTMLRLKSIITTTAVTFQKNGYYRKSAVLVLKLS